MFKYFLVFLMAFAICLSVQFISFVKYCMNHKNQIENLVNQMHCSKWTATLALWTCKTYEVAKEYLCLITLEKLNRKEGYYAMHPVTRKPFSKEDWIKVARQNVEATSRFQKQNNM